ncbi:MAG: glycosyltransferase family 2 protein [Bacilli bacterium]
MKKVSIIIPVHNSEKYILECMNSVINQTYKNLEIILIDDKSTDNSVNIIKSIKDKRIRLIELKQNSGAAIARNKGIEASTGDYICFLDSDDYWKLKKIEKQVKYIKDKAFIYSEYLYLSENKTHIAHVPKSLTYEELLKNSAIFTSTVMLNMKYLNKEDIYMPNMRMGQDYGAWYKILKKINIAYGMQEVLSIYRVGNISLSSNKFKAIKRTWNLYKQEELPLLKRIHCFICYAYNAVKRRIK